MADLSEIFGTGKLSYDEFLIKAGESGTEFGDVGELRRAFEDELNSYKRSSALESELDRAGVKNRDLVSKVIDMNAVTVDADGVHGIREQIDTLRTSDPYLFESAALPKNERQTTVRTGFSHTHEPLDSDSLSDSDFYKRIKMM